MLQGNVSAKKDGPIVPLQARGSFGLGWGQVPSWTPDLRQLEHRLLALAPADLSQSRTTTLDSQPGSFCPCTASSGSCHLSSVLSSDTGDRGVRFTLHNTS